jgi:hypothetical protein
MAKSRQPRGRPKKPTVQAKSELLQVRVSAQEKAAFADAAALDGEELSTWARRLMRRAATERMREAGQPDPFVG